MTTGPKPKFYILYLAENDTIVATGSAAECAKQMGLKDKSNFLSIISKVRKGKIAKYEFIMSDTDTLGGDE